MNWLCFFRFSIFWNSMKILSRNFPHERNLFSPIFVTQFQIPGTIVNVVLLMDLTYFKWSFPLNFHWCNTSSEMFFYNVTAVRSLKFRTLCIILKQLNSKHYSTCLSIIIKSKIILHKLTRYLQFRFNWEMNK